MRYLTMLFIMIISVVDVFAQYPEMKKREFSRFSQDTIVMKKSDVKICFNTIDSKLKEETSLLFSCALKETGFEQGNAINSDLYVTMYLAELPCHNWWVGFYTITDKTRHLYHSFLITISIERRYFKSYYIQQVNLLADAIKSSVDLYVRSDKIINKNDEIHP